MNKQDMLKTQTCVLRVMNIHCDGCKHKVKKKLQKVEGVYKVSIDVEQGKVTVSGNVDPTTLIKKLEKAGKHAEPWGSQKGPISVMNNQLKNIQIHNANGGKDIKTQKGVKDQQKGGFQAPQQMHQNKGSKGVKFMGKNQKSVKLNLPEDEEDDDFDDFSEDDEEFDDEFDEGFVTHQPPTKMAGWGGPANTATLNGHLKGNKAANKGGNGKKGGGGFDTFLKGMLGKVGGKNGNVGKSGKRAGNQNEGGKNYGYLPGEGKTGATNVKGADHIFGGGGKSKDSWSKKVGENFDGGKKLDNKQHGFNEINANHKGGGGRNMDLMGGQMGNFQAVQGLPTAAAAMNAGHFQGVGQGNPYNQQQYMAQMMMMMNQQRENGYDSHHPSSYMRLQPAMSYGPPLGDQYTHIFSDENTGSCNIM